MLEFDQGHAGVGEAGCQVVLQLIQALRLAHRAAEGAAQALNLKYVARMRFVVLPQAFKIALPPTVGYMVQIIKGTSLAAIIGFTEITRAGQIINNATFQPLHVFTTVAALYFVICWPLSLLAARMERKRARALAR